MSLVFKKYTANAARFFNILPKDWQKDIVPCWNEYAKHTNVYVLIDDKELIGGGMVFSSVSPDMKAVSGIADRHYQKGLLYIAFIWIAKKHRNKGLGSFWLQKLTDQHPDQGYWLTIEDPHLKRFYENLGFTVTESYLNHGKKEWVMIRYT